MQNKGAFIGIRQEKEFAKSYLLAGSSVLAGCVLKAGVSVLVAGTSVLAAGATFAFASGTLVSVDTGTSVAVSGFAESTETLPVSAGIAKRSADNMKAIAAPIVIFDNTVAVPRGANAELDTLLVNRAPASVLPGCSKTAATKTKQERKNIPYKI
jgi:hypothetical protein